MKKTVKLSPKQLEIVTETQKKKSELRQALELINDKEGLVVQLIMEANEITSEDIEKVDLIDGSVVFTLKEKKKEKVKKE